MGDVEKTVMFSLPNLLTGHVSCVDGTLAGRSWDIGLGTFTIGRSDEHDLCLADEAGVSKTHAKIVGHGDRFVLMDCESRNGTLLNGTAIHTADLFDGDEIRICGCVLQFHQRGGPRRAPQAAAPQTAAPQMAAPQMAAPQMAAPQMAAPQMAANLSPPSQAVLTTHAASPSTSSAMRVLVGWYAAGFLCALAVGGIAAAVLTGSSSP
jgi:predicted component of type VI protein secretion system